MSRVRWDRTRDFIPIGATITPHTRDLAPRLVFCWPNSKPSFNQCWTDVDRPSTTLAQHRIGWNVWCFLCHTFNASLVKGALIHLRICNFQYHVLPGPGLPSAFGARRQRCKISRNTRYSDLSYYNVVASELKDPI